MREGDKVQIQKLYPEKYITKKVEPFNSALGWASSMKEMEGNIYQLITIDKIGKEYITVKCNIIGFDEVYIYMEDVIDLREEKLKRLLK